jgi:hypothetical protein
VDQEQEWDRELDQREDRNVVEVDLDRVYGLTLLSRASSCLGARVSESPGDPIPQRRFMRRAGATFMIRSGRQ